ncbi:hypothetical protein [Streptomyces sp. NPDC021622]|uniref:tetratricopeptide repeat protein n=1 Tax=Streptomyces sp. NPDC021622 TaxID=3155013 RepID=UPI00340847A4
MNTGEHAEPGTDDVRDGPTESAAALMELRRHLNDGLARARLTKTQLALRAGRGRTTVQEAFRTDAPVPSAETVVALARVLRLQAGMLLDLRRVAAAESGPAPGKDQGLGKPIGEWDPHHLEVHPAGPVPGGAAPGRHKPGGPERELPGYVPRAHDHVLAEVVLDAAQGRSRIVVLVGSSSTGKTRACWEAVQPLAREGWRLWHPFDPTRATAALDALAHVLPRTVVWLNEAQHYLGHPRIGERIAAAVHSILTGDEHRPVLVLGTLWPQYADEYTALPRAGAPDPHSRARELLAGRTLTVPDIFDPESLCTAATLARCGDQLLADALTRAEADGRLTQDLAGAPELLRRFEHGTPATRAVLEAAVDARRLGVGLHLPQAFLTDAALDYLSDQDYDALTEDWAESAFADLARAVHGKQAPLRRTRSRPGQRPSSNPHPAGTGGTSPVFRLADFLEQHGRTHRRALCPPTSFWAAAHTHLTHPDDLNNLADAARNHCRLQWAHHLHHRAAAAGSTDALVDLAGMRKEAGDPDGAEVLLRQAADADNTRALVTLARMREASGDRDAAEGFFRQALDAGDTDVLCDLARMREAADDRDAAEALDRQAADAGAPRAQVMLMHLREESGDRDAAETLARRAADEGDTVPLLALAKIRELAGDPNGAEILLQQALDAGDTNALIMLAPLREAAGDRIAAESLLQQALDAGDTAMLTEVARMREAAGDRDAAEDLLRRALDTGDSSVLIMLARLREAAGDRIAAAGFLRQAVDAGDICGLIVVASAREAAGDRDAAELLFREAADRGHYMCRDLRCHVRWWGDSSPWPYGLDPDGTPTPPWR